MTHEIHEFLQLFESSGDGVWAVDADQRIVLWNKVAEELLGYTAEEALGRFCYELLAGRDLGGRPVCRALCTISECARRGRPIHSFNLRVRDSAGHTAWIDVSGLVVPDPLAEDSYSALVHLFRLIDDTTTSVPPLRIRLLGPVAVQQADGSPVTGGFQRRAKVWFGWAREAHTLLAQPQCPVCRQDLEQTDLTGEIQ